MEKNGRNKMSLGYVKSIKKIELLMLVVLATFPVVNLYATPITSIGVADLLLLLLIMYYFIMEFRNGVVVDTIFMYKISIICLIIVNYIIVMIFTNGYMYKDILMRSLRFIVYMSVGIVFPITNERREIVRDIIKFLSVFATALLIFENIFFRLCGIYISGFIPGIPLMCEDAVKEQVTNIYIMGGRPFSVFSEPSAYAMYVGLCLTLEMWMPRDKNNFFLRNFLTVGLILSGSTTGLLSLLFIYSIFFLRRIWQHNFKFNMKDCIFVITLLPVIVYVLISSASVQSMIIRIINGGSSYDRIEGYKIFGTKYSYIEMAFGHGMNDNVEDFFMSSYPRLYYYWGIVGIILMSYFLKKLYNRIDNESKATFWFVIFMNIATGWFWGQFNLVSYALLVSKEMGDQDKKTEELIYK